MRFITLIIMFTGLFGCSNIQKKTISYHGLDSYMKEQPILSTPRDNIIFVNLLCFEDFDLDNEYTENKNFSYQGFFGEGVYSEHYYLWDNQRINNQKIESSGVETLTDNDLEGLVFEYSMEEDDAGEFLASFNLTKRTFIKQKKFIDQNSFNVFKHIEYSKEYYPKNKQPIKVYDDKEEVCYITTSW